MNCVARIKTKIRKSVEFLNNDSINLLQGHERKNEYIASQGNNIT